MTDASSHKSAPSQSGSSAALKPAGSESSRAKPVEAGSDGARTVISSRVPLGREPLGAGSLDSGGLAEGEQLGQFLLQKFIGGGGMGIVFRALDTTLNREVAVKVLSRDQSADEETLRRFRNEAQSAARLNHDNIARVHYVGEDRGVHYIVFEFIEGVNIRDLVERNGPLALDEAVSYTYQIAAALEHASQRSVIHRDIKPSNVLISPDGRAKLVDMGLARLNQVTRANDDLTASGVTLGTFDYISPEQARDPRSADVRSDLYSLGCSFFYMLTGRPPFPDGTVLQKLLQHQADSPPDPRSLRPELPTDVNRILARLLAKNPLERYQQPAELIRDLAALGDKLGMQLSSPRGPWVPPRPADPIARWRHHIPWAVALAALFLIVAVLDFFWSSGQGEVAGQVPLSTKKSVRPPTVAAPVDEPVGQRSAEPDTEADPPPTLDSRQAPEDDAGALESAPGSASQNASDKGSPQAPWFQQLAKSVGVDLGWAARAADAARNHSRAAAPSSADPPSADATSADDAQPGSPPIAPSKASVGRDDLLIVGEQLGPHAFASLHAACSKAKNGDTIELRFNGRRSEKPITVSNIRLTIRAGADYQPVVVFRPEVVDSVKYLPSMVSVVGGQIVVNGVHWELDLPHNVAADWALFESRRAELVQFQKCTFTIRNASIGQAAYHAGVSFFDIKAPPGTGGMAMEPGAMEEQIVTISLQHCLARGEAALVRNNEQQAMRLNWDNGLLATSERLLIASGGPSQPRQLGHVQLNLRHVTAMVHDGVALLTNREDAPYQLLTEINCDDSIFVCTTSPPLVEQRGSDSVDQYKTRLQWGGDHDFFDGFEVFWHIASSAAETGSRQYRFDEWREAWRRQSRWQVSGHNSVRWRELPGAQRAFHTHAPSDYALDSDATDNPALGGASDGLDVGCVAQQLPALPPAERTDANPAARGASVPPRSSDGS